MADDAGWIRDREQSIGMLVISVAFAIFMVISGITGVRRTGVASTPITFAIAAAWLWFGIARCALAGARAEPDGLRVRNPLRTHLLPWKSILGVRAGSRGIWPFVAIVDLDDFRSIAIWAVQAANPTFRRKAIPRLEAQVGRLNAIVREHQSAESGE